MDIHVIATAPSLDPATAIHAMGGVMGIVIIVAVSLALLFKRF